MVTEYRYKDQKKLRCGYTTGSCAAAAAKGAAFMLVTKQAISNIRLITPKKVSLELLLEHTVIDKNSVICGIRKDAGDDPDLTNGVMVYAKVERVPKTELEEYCKKESCYCCEDSPFLYLQGGEGIGLVTRKGLSCPVGKAAINPVPRSMIFQEVLKIYQEYGETEGLLITVSIPEAKSLASKTFNPNLGIAGGISILGTTGIVEPMSEQALVDTIKLEIQVKAAEGREYLTAVLGNYGEAYISKELKLDSGCGIKCSNFIGETIDSAKVTEIKGLLFVGHMGKLVKLAGGIMNTHSRYGDSRMELIAAYGALAGGSQDLIRKLLNAITTDEALEILHEEPVYEETILLLLERIYYHLNRRAAGMEIGAILFSNSHGFIGCTEKAEDLLEKIRNERTRSII